MIILSIIYSLIHFSSFQSNTLQNIHIESAQNQNGHFESVNKNMLDKSLEDCVCKNQLILDGNIDIYENKECLKEWIDKIKEIVK